MSVETLPEAFKGIVHRLEDAFIRPVLDRMRRELDAAAGIVWTEDTEWHGLTSAGLTWTTTWYGYGGEGMWTCEGCGRIQAGEKPWPNQALRCVACGPGDGWVPCPAGAEPTCVLCKGIGYVEELR